MQRFELNVGINKPVKEVWQFLTEPYFASQWMRGVDGIVKIGDQAIAEGTKLKCCRFFVGRRIWTNIEVTKFEEHELFELFSEDRDVQSRYTYRLSPQKDGPIKLQLVVEYKIGGFASFFSGIFDKLIEEHEVDHLERFKMAIDPEAEADHSPTLVHISEFLAGGPGTVKTSLSPEEAIAEAEAAPPEPVVPRRTADEAEAMIAETLNVLDQEDRDKAQKQAQGEAAALEDPPSEDEEGEAQEAMSEASAEPEDELSAAAQAAESEKSAKL